MIDIHSHILPGVDDGAPSVEQSGRMLDLAVEGGTTAMVATPHDDLRYRFDAQRASELLAELQERSRAPRLYLGSEVHLTPENIVKVTQNPATFTLNGGDCLLLELPDRILPSIVEPAIEALAHVGLRVILAHPERNAYIQQVPSYSDRLVDKGCFLQLTSRSLLGLFGAHAASTAKYILRRRLAHFIASDAHGTTSRRPGLTTVFHMVANSFGRPPPKSY
jgi:protein-tyrosine phosphatase